MPQNITLTDCLLIAILVSILIPKKNYSPILRKIDFKLDVLMKGLKLDKGERHKELGIDSASFSAIELEIKAGNKIQAIKLLRDKTSLELKEAKDIVENISRDMGPSL
jgi:hypothetical protein